MSKCLSNAQYFDFTDINILKYNLLYIFEQSVCHLDATVSSYGGMHVKNVLLM